MSKKRYTAEQIIQLLREVEIHTSQGKTIAQAARQYSLHGGAWNYLPRGCVRRPATATAPRMTAATTSDFTSPGRTNLSSLFPFSLFKIEP